MVVISTELSTSQLEICKVIILLCHFKKINSELIVKFLWGWMGSTFKTLLCKIVELVMAYNVKAGNKTLQPKIFYVLYIGPNNSGTDHSVFKLSTKQLLTTPKRKLVPMPEDIIQHMFDNNNK